jgi:hypothetical protein
MTTILVLAGALLVVTLALLSIVHSLIRRQSRERDRLINQICHLSGKPWQPAPALSLVEPEAEPELDRYLGSPEQLPDY